MIFLEQLRSHKGSLIRLPTQLYWYNGGWDGTSDRICLLLDARVSPTHPAAAATPTAVSAVGGTASSATLLLIDGQPRWVWVAENDVELISETR